MTDRLLASFALAIALCASCSGRSVPPSDAGRCVVIVVQSDAGPYPAAPNPGF